MDRARSDGAAAEAPGAPPGPETDAAVLRRYYSERDFMTSPEGVMKLVSVMLCIVSSVLLLSSTCAGAGLRLAGAALELAAAAALAALSAARLLHLAEYAPMGYLIAELVVSAAAGVLVLVTAALGLSQCAARRAADYVHGAVGLTSAALVTGSAVITYAAVSRRWDGPHRAAAPRRPHAAEHDV